MQIENSNLLYHQFHQRFSIDKHDFAMDHLTF